MAGANRSIAVPRRAMIYFALALAVLIAAFWLWRGRRHDIDLATAGARAKYLLAAYIHDSGEPSAHFIAATTVGYTDGWEFAWRYGPCPEFAALKVFISRSGHASYSALPDCAPQHGFNVSPRQT